MMMMMTINKSAHTKKSGNLFNEPHIKERVESEISAVFVVIFKERRNCEKERKNESCDLWLAPSKDKRKESRQVVGESRLTSQQNGFFSFLNGLLVYASFESILTATRKTEKEREFLFFKII